MKKVEGLVIVGCLLMFVLSTVAVAANSNESGFIGGNETKTINVTKTITLKTIILNNVSNSFPMFSDAEYVNFTIGDNTITLSLDPNASFDGVCNLANLTGTNISAAGSFAKLNYSIETYQTETYDQKWKSAPYFDDTENMLHLLDGSGLITTLNLELKENATDKTIPKVVGFGDLIGQYQIETVAHGENSTHNDLALNMKGVGYTDLYVQYAHDTSYEDVPFLPTFSHCEMVQALIDSTICGSKSTVGYKADILGVVNGAEPIPKVSHDWNLSLEFDARYFPITYRNGSYNQTWELSPYFDEGENRLYLLSGAGMFMGPGPFIMDGLKIELKENTTDETIPKVVGVGDLVGQYHIETFAQCENSTYNDLTSNMVGVGYIDLYLQYAPDTSYENVTFIPTFSQCEKVELSVNTFGPAIEYVADVVGHANGVEYLEFYDVPLDSVAINETFDIKYHPVNISGDVFNETWSVTPEQYKDTLVILRGTGDITTLDFTFDDRNVSHPEICSYGYLRADPYAYVIEDIRPHYMRVFAMGPNVSAMDESGQGGFGITFT